MSDGWSIDLKIAGRLERLLNESAVQDALADGVRDLMQMGEAAVIEQLYPGHGLKTGYYRRSVHGQLRGRLHAEVNDSGVVYGPWLEGVSRRNERSRFKGYAMFRRAHEKLERNAYPAMVKALRRHGFGGG